MSEPTYTGTFDMLQNEQQEESTRATGVEAAITAQLTAIINSMITNGGGTSMADSLLTDDSGSFFLARDISGSVTYVTLTGATYTPTTNPRPPSTTALQNLLTGLTNLSTGVATLHSDNQTIETDLGTLHSDNASIESGIGTISVAVGSLHSDNTAIETDITATTTAVGVLHADNATIESDLSTLHTDNTTQSTALTQLHTDSQTLATDITSVNTSVGTLHTDNTTTQADIVATTTAVNTLHSDNSTTQTAIATTNTNLATLHADMSTLEGDVNALHTDNATVEANISAVNTSVGVLHSDNSVIETDINAVTTAVNVLHTDNTAVETALSTLHTDEQATQTDLVSINTSVGVLHTDNATIESDINAVTTAVNVLHADNTTIQSDLTQLHTDEQATATAINTLHSDNGVAGTGIAQPTGGSGLLGFMSGVFKTLTNGIGLLAGSNIIGKVGIDQSTPGTSNGVVATLAAGSSIAVTGITSAGDTITNISLTSASGTTEGVQRTTIVLNGAGLTCVQFSSIGVSGQIQCYGSLDGATWWGPMYATPRDANNNQFQDQPRMGGIGQGTVIYDFDTAGLAYFQLRVNALVSGTITGQVRTSQVLSNSTTLNRPINMESLRPTFKGGIIRQTTFVAAFTDVLELRTGASMVGRLKKVEIEAYATSVGFLDVTLQRNSLLDTATTGVGTTSYASMDSRDPGRLATLNYYATSAPTIPGAQSVLDVGRLYLNTLAATAGPTNRMVFDFAGNIEKAPTFSGTQSIALNLGGQAVPNGLTMSAIFTWTEEAV